MGQNKTMSRDENMIKLLNEKDRRAYRDDLLPARQPQTTEHEEYLRRNLLHAKAFGANANAKAALKKLNTLKRPQKWMIDFLEGIITRTESVHPEVAKWRDTAADRPEYVK